MSKHFFKVIKQYLHRVTAHLVSLILRPGAVYVSENFKLWEKHGYHITPIHFYSPIPDTHELEMRKWQPSSCHGIDLRPEFQLSLMKDDFIKFAPEYNIFPIGRSESHTFYMDNDAFVGIDPHVYYCMIHHFKPKTIVEVGSGYSTLLGAESSRLSGSIHYRCIDPWPREFIAYGIPGIDFIRRKVQDLDLDIFEQLQPDDILFIDSSHVVRTANDVCFIILEVLPRLRRGVIVHFHDIFLPFDYPQEWILEQQRFWTEQYLLQAYLTDNCHVEVLFASHFLSKTYPEKVHQTFPSALSMDGGSFWFRKI